MCKGNRILTKAVWRGGGCQELGFKNNSAKHVLGFYWKSDIVLTGKNTRQSIALKELTDEQICSVLSFWENWKGNLDWFFFGEFSTWVQEESCLCYYLQQFRLNSHVMGTYICEISSPLLYVIFPAHYWLYAPLMCMQSSMIKDVFNLGHCEQRQDAPTFSSLPEESVYRDRDLWVDLWVWLLVWALPGCMFLDEWLHLSEPRVPRIYKMMFTFQDTDLISFPQGGLPRSLI